MNKTSFLDYLKEEHAIDYIGTDDKISEDFDNWLESMDKDTLIEFGDTFGELLMDNQE